VVLVPLVLVSVVVLVPLVLVSVVVLVPLVLVLLVVVLLVVVLVVVVLVVVVVVVDVVLVVVVVVVVVGGDVHGAKDTLLVVVPFRLAMSLDLTSTRSVLKPCPATKEDTFAKQPVYVVVPGTMVNDNSAPVSTKTDEPGVCPVSLRVIVPAAGLSTVRVTQTMSFAQPCVSMDTTVGGPIVAYAVAVSSANAAHTLTRNIRARLLISISFFDARIFARADLRRSARISARRRFISRRFCERVENSPVLRSLITVGMQRRIPKPITSRRGCACSRGGPIVLRPSATDGRKVPRRRRGHTQNLTF